MKYKVESLVIRTIASLGNKRVADLKVIDITGAKFEGSMWEDFPSFGTVTFGSEFEADMVAKEKNGRTNYTFYPVRTAKPTSGAPRTFQGKASGAVEAAKITEKSVEKAQDTKELGIKISSTIRMAVDITLAEGGTPTMTSDDTQGRIEYWRKWLWEHWDAH